MSADLEFRQDLPRIQAPSAIKIQPLQQSRSSVDDAADSNIQENGDISECKTPTSKEHKIPPVLSCPPAPRKPKRVASCKRKLSEFEFFEIVNREEIESFFRSSFEVSAKRRCPCT